ncbi:hypothetical protein Slala03_65990 [Streptomyces lavendulae subsp. lavendulae]|uniref:hypothetical protein n=1 Tax=Streptomyces lavendulae TaxID=1914 RepID=UPI0024A4377C|nr:hypothetical protein [Streptomyces lavendulae]GLV86910.1 hypothetical protein Slala03_65990 [Streptomyces lavendulae subsp. lavendulae]
MLTLVLIGLLGGLIIAVSPCILPVLPVVFLAGGPDNESPPPATAGTTSPAGPEQEGGVLLETAPAASRGNRRPYAVVAGLVLSFSFFTLLGVTIISALGLPQDILRYVGLSLLVLIGLGLVFPRSNACWRSPSPVSPNASSTRRAAPSSWASGSDCSTSPVPNRSSPRSPSREPVVRSTPTSSP